MTEPDRPQVTVSDLGRTAAGADVLGADEPVRRLPRWVAPFAAGALLAGVSVPPAVSAVREDRREARAARVHAEQQAAQRVREDALSLRLSDVRLTHDSEQRTLSLTVTASSGGGLGVLVDALGVTGAFFEGVAEVPVSAVVDPAEAPAEVTAVLPVDCAAVRTSFAAGPRPTGVTVVLVATPRSGRQQQTGPVAVPDALLRDALLDTCQLGDPDIAPTATVEVIGGKVIALASTGRGVDTTVVGFRLAGVALRTSGPLPVALARQTTLVLELEIDRVDCARFAGGPLVVVFGAPGGGRREVTAGPGDQPGSTPFADYLARLKQQRCR